MKWHTRCKHCRARRKLPKHPGEYRNLKTCPRCKHGNDKDCERCQECSFVLSLAPSCDNCGDRRWRVDEFRQNHEKHQWRIGSGRYARCYGDCHHFVHRMGSPGCKFDASGEYRLHPAM